MHLVVHLACQESQLERPMEKDGRMQWQDAPPTVGYKVRFGSVRDFEVRKVYSFKPVENAAVDAVHIAFSESPGSHVPIDQWGCWRWLEHVPHLSFFVQLEDAGLPDLSYGIDATGEPPKLGERIHGGLPAGEGTRMISAPTPWVIDRYDTYKPVGESPYTDVYLTWCKVVPMESPLAKAA